MTFESDDDSESDSKGINEAFSALTVKADFNFDFLSDVNPSSGDQIGCFATSCFASSDATLLITELNDRAVGYLIAATGRTHDNSPVNNSENDLYNANIYTATSANLLRYNASQFYSIMIDTGASKHSTAGYSQLQALQR
ncbi:hypothetical protein B0O99DRAFT_74736 [Bisporella sp. PMI_857]|nr:hypothetical protein B0O99DRAFT_74736 [Bisporella sp. PMI_857]